ncbi:MAG TPA: hypothetical protein DCM86_02205 [Verrucomicrobiales bacterium]|nr:hypothetical protein [Verrucomicrobiales bacterium]
MQRGETLNSDPDERTRRIESLAGQVLEYLSRHPHAMDDLHGIAAWWLEEQRARTLESDVLEALELLVQRGQARRRVQADGQVYFSASPGGAVSDPPHGQ